MRPASGAALRRGRRSRTGTRCIFRRLPRSCHARSVSAPEDRHARRFQVNRLRCRTADGDGGITGAECQLATRAGGVIKGEAQCAELRRKSRGTLPHLTAERFKVQTGADLTYIPYPGASAGLQDLMGGRISVIVEGFGTLLGAIQSGSLKALAVSSLNRLADFPTIPTIAET